MGNIYALDGIELTKEQYKILKQFNEHDALHIKDIRFHASKTAVNDAIQFFLINKFIVRFFDYDLQKTIPDKYRITEYGIQVCSVINQHRHDFVANSVFVPIIVTIATELILHGILWLLPPTLRLITNSF